MAVANQNNCIKNRLRNIRVTANSLKNNKKKIPGEYWTNNEKAKLYNALYKYGDGNVKLIASLVHTRTADEVKAKINHFKNLCSKAAHCHENVNNVINQCDLWLNKMQRVDLKPGRVYPLQMSFKILELLADHPDPKDYHGINLQGIYGWLYDCMCGHATRRLDAASSAFLLKLLDEVMTDIRSDADKICESNPLFQLTLQIRIIMGENDVESEQKMHLNGSKLVNMEAIAPEVQNINIEKQECSKNKRQINIEEMTLEEDNDYEQNTYSETRSQMKTEVTAIGKDYMDVAQETYLKKKIKVKNVGTTFSETNINSASKIFPKNKKGVKAEEIALVEDNECEKNTCIKTRSQVKTREAAIGKNFADGGKVTYLKKRTQNENDQTTLNEVNIKSANKRFAEKKTQILPLGKDNEEDEKNTYLKTRSQIRIEGSLLSEDNMYGGRGHFKKNTQDKTEKAALRKENKKSGKQTYPKKLQVKNKGITLSEECVMSEKKTFSKKKSLVKTEGIVLNTKNIKSGKKTYSKKLQVKNEGIALSGENVKIRKETNSKKLQVKSEGIALSNENIKGGKKIYLTRLQVKNKGIELNSENIKGENKMYSKKSRIKNEGVALSEKSIKNEKKIFSKKKSQDKNDGTALSVEKIECRKSPSRKVQIKNKCIALFKENVKSGKKTYARKLQVKNKGIALSEDNIKNEKNTFSKKKLQVKNELIALNEEDKIISKKKTSSKILQVKTEGVALSEENKNIKKKTFSKDKLQVKNEQLTLNIKNGKVKCSKKKLQMKVKGQLLGIGNILEGAKEMLFDSNSQVMTKGKKRKIDDLNKEHPKEKLQLIGKAINDGNMEIEKKVKQPLVMSEDSKLEVNLEKRGEIAQVRTECEVEVNEVKRDVPEICLQNLRSQVRLKLRSACAEVGTDETPFDQENVYDTEEISSSEEVKLTKENTGGVQTLSQMSTEHEKIKDDDPDLLIFSLMLEDYDMNPLNLPAHLLRIS